MSKIKLGFVCVGVLLALWYAWRRWRTAFADDADDDPMPRGGAGGAGAWGGGAQGPQASTGAAARRRRRRRGAGEQARADPALAADIKSKNNSNSNTAPAAEMRTLFVCDIPEDLAGGGRVVKKALVKAFGAHRPKQVKVCVTHHGRTRGWAHVSFGTQEAALAALEAVQATLAYEQHPLRVCPALDKRDILFPSLTMQQRAALQLDGVALYSTADEHSGKRLASLLVLMAGCALGAPSALGSVYYLINDKPRELDDADVGGPASGGRCDLVVTDANACVGGLTFCLARTFLRVHAVELDPQRFEHLRHNGTVVELSNIDYHCGDYIELMGQLQQDIVVLDPPWGGPQYSANDIITDLPLGNMTLTELLLALRSHCDLVAVRLPLNYDLDRLVQRLVSAPPAASAMETPTSLITTRVASPTASFTESEWVKLSPANPRRAESVDLAASTGSATSAGPGLAPPASLSHSDRPFPFRIEFDVSRLLLVCFPARRASRLHFELPVLDPLIAQLNAWNAAHGREHHPAFYDWEKQRWIQLSRWRGCRDPSAPAAAAAADADVTIS